MCPEPGRIAAEDAAGLDSDALTRTSELAATFGHNAGFP